MEAGYCQIQSHTHTHTRKHARTHTRIYPLYMCTYVCACIYILFVGSAVDFDSGPKNVSIAPENTTTIVTIPVMCDRLIEGTEMFDINLSLISVSHNVTVQLGLSKSIGVIEDSTG